MTPINPKKIFQEIKFCQEINLKVYMLTIGTCIVFIFRLHWLIMCGIDETPGNCQQFIDGDGLNVFLACFNVSSVVINKFSVP